MAKLTYQCMYETRNVRPYYTIPHIGIYGKLMEEFLGFSYKDIVYIVSADMNNSAYFSIEEMQKATDYFRDLWSDPGEAQKVIDGIRNRFEDIEKVEKRAWRQSWPDLGEDEIVKEVRVSLDSVFQAGVAHIVSQPQHILPLEEKLGALLEGKSNYDVLLKSATQFKGKMPWDEEDHRINGLRDRWAQMSDTEKDKELRSLVRKYGWINEVEGEKPFSIDHYRQKIESHEKETDDDDVVDVPDEIKVVGQLIGELGYLRFWSRYHLLHTHYHVKKLLEEIIRRTGKDDLEYATVEEAMKLLVDEDIDAGEIERRKMGYAARLENGEAVIVTGSEAGSLRKIVEVQDLSEIIEVRGTVANRGKVTGRVRVVSFSANDYQDQVDSFRENEVLVTGMTRPQIVHLCGKAVAIVTDEGGITSHAAVVSREFNKPCVIGTGNATKVFKTGDLVEVDADKGVVRIVEKK